jgi:hypothetical protein
MSLEYPTVQEATATVIVTILWLVFCEAQGYLLARFHHRHPTAHEHVMLNLAAVRPGELLAPLFLAFLACGALLTMGLLMVYPAIHHGRYFLTRSNIEAGKFSGGYWHRPNRLDKTEKYFVGPKLRRVLLFVGGVAILASTFAA